MYAIIRDRGNQYKVTAGDVVDVDLMDNVQAGDPVSFKDVLLTSDAQGEVRLGEPSLTDVTVSGEILLPVAKGKKIDVVHFRRRKDSMDKKGHRQKYTRVKISSIETAA